MEDRNFWPDHNSREARNNLGTFMKDIRVILDENQQLHHENDILRAEVEEHNRQRDEYIKQMHKSSAELLSALIDPNRKPVTI